LLGVYRDEWAGCVVADLRLPGRSGIELQAELRARGSRLPFILITAHGSTAAARSAFRLDAIDFLEKPFDDEELRAAIERGFEREAHRIDEAGERRAGSRHLRGLSPREREVLELVGRGLHAREIAGILAISPRTVDVHKAHLMDKLGVFSAAGLIRYALMAEKSREGS
jgi:FixJ family two-component response regulator